MENLLHLRNDAAQLAGQMDQILKAANSEKRDMTADEQERFDKLEADLEKLEARIERAQKNERAAERIKKALSGKPEAETKEQADQREALANYFRTGVLTDTRGLIASDDAKGGYLAPKEFVQEMLSEVTEIAPFRSVARIIQTSARSVQFPKRTATFSAVWVGEQSTRSETEGLRFGLEEIPTHEMSAVVDVSEQMLEDAAFDIEGYIRSEAAEQFAVAEATAFITGNGVAKPWGVTVDTAVTNTNSGSNGDFDADDLIDLLYSLKGAYLNSAAWMFNRATLRKIRKLKSNNEYIWSPLNTYPNNVVRGLAGTILDRPFFIAPEMQSTGTTANVSVIVGDFRRGYLIVDRVAMSMKRDEYTQASAGNIRFWFRKRVGGQIVQGEAIKRLQEST